MSLVDVTKRLVDKAMEIQVACERKLTQNLTPPEKKQFSKFLKRMNKEENLYVNN